MKKKIGFLIAMAITLNVATASFVKAADAGSNTVALTLEQAVSSVESSSEELKNIDIQIEAANKQYDWDKQQSLYISVNNHETQYGPGQFLYAVIQRDIVPLADKQKIDSLKNSKEEKISTIKFDLQKQYMKLLTYEQQIDNLNKYVTDIDAQIKQLQAKIDLGQATSDQLNSLKVQRNDLFTKMSGLKALMEGPSLTIKKYLNLDLNSELKLSPAKKDFAKFDDTDIEKKIAAAAEKDYSYGDLKQTTDLSKKQLDVYTKYVYDSVTEPMNSQLTVKDNENKLADTYTSTEVSLWNSYYNLKNKEDSVQTQKVALEAAELSYNKAKESYDKGFIDKVTLDLAELNLSNQKVTTEDAVNDYMVAQEQFKYLLDGHASSGAID